jgi:S-adenosylmethionine:tRNA ribosyltransferase-isomerase
LHQEAYSITAGNATRMNGSRRLVAVGSTSVRTIESAAHTGALGGETGLFICPGYAFRRTGAMVTNFHLPRSSLLVLACAFGGTDFVLAAYRHAVGERYRFYSYGDCMLIL